MHTEVAGFKGSASRNGVRLTDYFKGMMIILAVRRRKDDDEIYMVLTGSESESEQGNLEGRCARA